LKFTVATERREIEVADVQGAAEAAGGVMAGESPLFKDLPLVTVGLPVHNGGDHLREALDSLLAQDYPNFVVLLSDNASTDQTSDLCREYAARDQRVRHLPTDALIEIAANFRRVALLAVGEYFMWAAHDDLWEPTFVSSMVRSLEAHPGAVLAFSRFDNIDDAGLVARTFAEDWPSIWRYSRRRQFASMALLDESRTQKANHFYGLMRRDALRQCLTGCRPVTGFAGEDIVTLTMLLRLGEFIVVDRLLFHYRTRRLIIRDQQPMMRYMLVRILRSTPGHRGSLVLMVVRNHVYFSSLRSVIRDTSELSLADRFALRAALAVKEIIKPLATIPPAVVRELGLVG
jgi:glycosyltransferase involved in cell wall biosynthesis